MGLGKRILDNAAARAAVAHLAAGYIGLVHATGRWQTVRGEIPQRFWDAGTPFIGAFWHGRLMMMPKCWDARATVHVLISEHRDGRLIARAIRVFGYRTIAGSTHKGGAAALRNVLRAVEAGECVAITPDGPRGPRMRASLGVIAAARLSGAPIVPGTFAAGPRTVAGSWDRMIVPWPFGRGVFVWGEPVHVPRDADAAAQEACRNDVEARLTAITAEADALVGQTPIEPAPAGPAGRGTAAASGR